MSPDPPLASPLILALAARRATARQVAAPPRTIELQIVYYDARGLEPDELGERYTYELPPQPGARPRYGPRRCGRG